MRSPGFPRSNLILIAIHTSLAHNTHWNGLSRDASLSSASSEMLFVPQSLNTQRVRRKPAPESPLVTEFQPTTSLFPSSASTVSSVSTLRSTNQIYHDINDQGTQLPDSPTRRFGIPPSPRPAKALSPPRLPRKKRSWYNDPTAFFAKSDETQSRKTSANGAHYAISRPIPLDESMPQLRRCLSVPASVSPKSPSGKPNLRPSTANGRLLPRVSHLHIRPMYVLHSKRPLVAPQSPWWIKTS